MSKPVSNPFLPQKMYYIEVGGKPEVTVSQTCVCSYMLSRASGLEHHVIAMYVGSQHPWIPHNRYVYVYMFIKGSGHT